MKLRVLSSGELTQMKSTQLSSLMDSCQVLSWSEGPAGEYNQPTDVFSAGAVIPCGFNARGREVQKEDRTILVTDAQVRLPAGTAVKAQDRIRLVSRLGTALPQSQDFEIVGPVREGPSGIQLDLQKVDI